MKKLKLNLRVTSIALAFTAISATGASAQTFPLLTGDIVVTLYGKANTPQTSGTYLDGVPTPISLQEFSPVILPGIDNTTPLLSESLPTTGTGANVGIVGETGSSSEGTIQVSGDGRYLTLGGYDGNQDEVGAPTGGYSNANGTPEAQSINTDVPRVAAVINIATGNVDTSTVLNDVYNTNNPRSVYSTNGSTLFISGQGAGVGDQGGLYQTTTGTNTVTSPMSAPTPIFNVASTRNVTLSTIDAATGGTSPGTGPNLYYSADQNSKTKGNLTGIFENPTTSPNGQQMTGTQITPATLVVGSTTYALSPEGFFFANPTTLYVADTGSPKGKGTSDGGIQKWSFSTAGNLWTLDYTLTYAFSKSSSETGFASLAGQVVNGVVDLYSTSYTFNDADPDGLYAVVDTLTDTTAAQAANEQIVQLAASQTDSDFKGVAIIPDAVVPEPSTYALLFGSVGLLAFLARRKAAARA